MTVTYDQALTASVFHENHEPGVKIYRWRRNGRTQVWKTRPNDFRVPIKYGLRSYDQLTPVNAHLMHTEDDCPDNHSNPIAQYIAAHPENTVWTPETGWK